MTAVGKEDVLQAHTGSVRYAAEDLSRTPAAQDKQLPTMPMLSL